MIYAPNTPDSVSLMIPRNGFAIEGDLTFSLRSTMDKDIPVETEVEDLGTSALFVNVAVTLPEGLPCGEYEYILRDEEKVISTGLMVLMGENETNEYSNETIYEQYETE